MRHRTRRLGHHRDRLGQVGRLDDRHCGNGGARTPDEFGAARAFLCSAQAGYITGRNLLIDGGAYPGTF